MMVRYVAGFGIYREKGLVLLVRKTKPDWQAGLLNAVGGKVDGDELFAVAMRREYREETGIDVPDWDLFAEEYGPGYFVRFFRTFLSKREYESVGHGQHNDVNEELGWYDTDICHYSPRAVVGNLQWLLPLTKDPRKIFVTASTRDAIRERPTW
jgi:8-oxo-dGTP pyrophosphatase MutT (NUDIX family)